MKSITKFTSRCQTLKGSREMRIKTVTTVHDVRDYLSDTVGLHAYCHLSTTEQADVLRTVIDSDVCEFDDVWPSRRHIPAAESMLMRALAEAAAARHVLDRFVSTEGNQAALERAEIRVELANQDVTNLLLDSLVAHAMEEIEDLCPTYSYEDAHRALPL